MIWWAEQPVRAQAERADVGALAERSPWLKHSKWRLAEDLQLAVDFDLNLGDRVVPLTLVFPAFFPDAAPSVFSRDGVRLSGHQYGDAGELCLQLRPDNWSPENTGAMMIESAYELLSTEAATGETAPSEHRTTRAQDARGATFRFLLTDDALAALGKLGERTAEEGSVAEHGYAGCFAAQLASMGSAKSPWWVETEPRGSGAKTISCWVVRLKNGIGALVRGVDELTSLLHDHGLDSVASDFREKRGEMFVILFDGTRAYPVLTYRHGDTLNVINYDVVVTESAKPRVGPEYARVRDSRVAVVGCGSVGSKVAAHLARAGFRKFVLVDGDLLASGNLVRNELDWRAVGLHKAPSLEARLKEIASGCDVATSTTLLGGQESGSRLANAMSVIESCDIIIEATADPNVFNLCAAVARRAQKPLFWSRVFGGGVGGIVVRLRPQLDPSPVTARQRIKAFYEAQDIPWTLDETDNSYSAVDDGTPLIADDADVAVLAAHLARFVIDFAVRPTESIFPHSAYLIGLREAWAFLAPFDTQPIDLGASDGWDVRSESGAPEALQILLNDLLPKKTAPDEG